MDVSFATYMKATLVIAALSSANFGNIDSRGFFGILTNNMQCVFLSGQAASVTKTFTPMTGIIN